MPIRSVAVLVVAALAGASALALVADAAPIANPVTLSASALAADVTPGGTASFTILVQNGAALPQSVSFSATRPANWSYDFQPISVNLTANGNNSTTFVITAASEAQPGSNYTATVLASNAIGAASDPLTLTLHVVAPPPTATPPPAIPKLSVRIADSTGTAGNSVDGLVQILDSDIRDLTVSFTSNAPNGWAVSWPDANAKQAHPDQPTRLRVRVSIPADAANGTVAQIALLASVDGSTATYPATWNVTALAPASGSTTTTSPPASDAGPSTKGSTGSSGGSSTTTSPTPAPQETFNLAVTVFPDPVQIAPGESTRATVRVTNTGTQPLHLALAGTAADNWPLGFAPASLDVQPGVTTDVAMTLTAPSGIFPGGTGSGSVMVQGNSGLLRTATFKLSIVPPAAPRDDSKTSTAIVAPPAAGPTFSVQPTTALLVVGAGAIGVGALVIARARGAREKLLWIGVGLYTRLLKPDVLGHPERDRLYKLVEAQPGVHFHALQRELQWNTGTLTYHLRVLEKHGFIVDRRDGPYRRFYLQGSAPRKELFSQDAPQGLRADVLEAVRNRHGISQGDLALALGANKQTVNYHVKALERAGQLRIEKRGRETFLYPTNAPGLGPGEVPA